MSDWSALAFFTTLSTCEMPAGLNTTNTTTTVARANWNAAAGANSYTLRYRVTSPPGSDLWKAATGTGKWLTPLTLGTDYSYEVRSVCTSGNSAWSATETFSTPASKEATIGDVGISSVSLYPNPVHDFIFINYKMEPGQAPRLEVFDMLGRVAISQSLDSGEGTLRLETGSLASGHYLLKIRNGNEMLTKRFLIIE
jgi:hypothetical protein